MKPANAIARAHPPKAAQARVRSGCHSESRAPARLLESNLAMPRRALLWIVSGLVAAGLALSARAAPFESYATSDDRSELFARWNAEHGDAYALDEVKRFIEWTGRAKPRIECDRAGMVAYSGS